MIIDDVREMLSENGGFRLADVVRERLGRKRANQAVIGKVNVVVYQGVTFWGIHEDTSMIQTAQIILECAVYKTGGMTRKDIDQGLKRSQRKITAEVLKRSRDLTRVKGSWIIQPEKGLQK